MMEKDEIKGDLSMVWVGKLEDLSDLDDYIIKISAMKKGKTKLYYNGILWTRWGRFVAWFRRKILGWKIYSTPMRAYKTRVKRFGRLEE